jgi:ABC-type lipoprotein release transport system permease subunit
MLAWHLGLRYLRKRRAAWLALAAITLTVAVPVVVLGVMQGVLDVTRRQVRANESDITVELWWTGDSLADSEERRADLRAIPGIAAVAPFVSTYAILTPTGAKDTVRWNLPCLVDAVEWRADEVMGRITAPVLHPDPVLDLHVPPLPPTRRGTGFLTPDWRGHLALLGMESVAGLGLGPLPLPPRLNPAPGVVVGRELAFGHGLRPGQGVQLVVPNGSGGATGKIGAEISDIIGTGVYEVDRYACLVPLPLGQRLADFHSRNGKAARLSGYRLQVKDESKLMDGVKAVTEATGLRARTWMERRGNLVKSLEIQRNILGLVMVCIQVIAVFIVYAVFSTLVAEKRHDIGVLIGIGATRRAVAGAFLIAGMVACVAGGLLGWGIGWAGLAGLNPVSTWLNVPLFPQDVFYTPQAPISWNPLIPLFFMGVMGLVGLAAVALPAWRASRVDPIETLREAG